MSIEEDKQYVLSIIVPIYNVEKYLQECLDSIYKIKNITFEVILVNDESPDNCSKIIASYADRYSHNTKVIEQKNGGLSAARNAGLNIASGKYISFVDSDDIIISEVLVELCEAGLNLDLDIVAANTLTFLDNDRTEVAKIEAPVQLTNRVMKGIDYLESAFLLGYKRINCWNKIYKASFLKTNNLEFEHKLLFEDIPFTFDSFFIAEKVLVIPKFLYLYRQRQGSIMTTSGQRTDHSRIKIVKHILSLLERHKYKGNAFDDYIIYLIWEYAHGTKTYELRLLFKMFIRRKYSFRGLFRLIIVALFIPRILND